MPEPRFEPCMQDQPMLLPPDIGDLVPEGSMPRVVDMVVRSIDRSTLTALYPGGGAPAHDPQMMLKVVLLAYASGIYSSRAIARATRTRAIIATISPRGNSSEAKKRGDLHDWHDAAPRREGRAGPQTVGRVLPESPSRAIPAGGGGSGASRHKHVARCESGRYRRLAPDELDQLQALPKGWADTGMSDGRGAFCMGRALSVGVPRHRPRDCNLSGIRLEARSSRISLPQGDRGESRRPTQSIGNWQEL